MNDACNGGAQPRALARTLLRDFILELADLIAATPTTVAAPPPDAGEKARKTTGRLLKVGTKADERRFRAKVLVGDPSGCWEWQGALADNGYGMFFQGGRMRLAHRYAYAIAHGSIPAGALVLHACDNRLCVNPVHLRTGTHRDNTEDAVRRRRLAVGERNPQAKLSLAMVRHIRSSGENAKVLAERYDVALDTIYAIRRRAAWRFPEAMPGNDEPEDNGEPTK